MAQQRTLKKVETTHKSEKDLLPRLPNEVNEIIRKLQDAAKCRYQFLEERQRKIRQKQNYGVYLALAGGIVAAIALGVQILFWWLGAAGLIMIVTGSVFTVEAMHEESNERKYTTADVVRIHQLMSKGKNFSQRLRERAENLNQLQRKFKKAKSGEDLSTFVSGVITMVDDLTPKTGRDILPFAGARMVLSGARDLVTNGSTLIEIIVQIINGRDLQKEWDEITSAVLTECQVLNKMPQTCTTNLHIFDYIFVFFVNVLFILRNWNSLQNFANIMVAAARHHEGAYDSGWAAKNVGLEKASAGVQAKEFFPTLAMLANNFTEIVRAVVDLMKDQKPEALHVLLKLADCTEEIIRELRNTSEMLCLFSDKHHCIS